MDGKEENHLYKACSFGDTQVVKIHALLLFCVLTSFYERRFMEEFMMQPFIMMDSNYFIPSL